ncbi:Uncharacterized mitochondrial protein AtMg01110 [Striga hermonthica]|uniref:Uncharacterized mitochondrial protein AtMg01110 n=1 Tax=Striga hermonthica TaxID=68872 RepID=A0A9N7NQ28_STRHE|nr:Uncharacterized mitochondrial protein AtMg01110 [Striga hermonthica]
MMLNKAQIWYISLTKDNTKKGSKELAQTNYCEKEPSTVIEPLRCLQSYFHPNGLFAIHMKYGVKKRVKPFHDWAMSVLSTLRTDGTFDQLRSLHRLKGHKVLYSFDLKAATDMLPKNLTDSMLKGLFGEEIGLVWYDIMNNTAFRSPERLKNPTKARVYRFTTSD